MILGSPVYHGDISVGLHALYERLIFQSISHKLDPSNYCKEKVAVVSF